MLDDKEKMQVERTEIEQVAEIQLKLNDQKKWLLYGFLLGLKSTTMITNE